MTMWLVLIVSAVAYAMAPAVVFEFDDGEEGGFATGVEWLGWGAAVLAALTAAILLTVWGDENARAVSNLHQIGAFGGTWAILTGAASVQRRTSFFIKPRGLKASQIVEFTGAGTRLVASIRAVVGLALLVVTAITL